MGDVIRFFVPGKPTPAGSKSFRGMNKAGKAIISDSSKHAPGWKHSIVSTYCSLAEEQGFKTFAPKTPLEVRLEFYMPRPQKHFGTGKNEGKVKERFVHAGHTVKPDVLKLARCVEDALTGFAYHDDCDTVSLTAAKRYATPEYGQHPGVLITIRRMG